MPSRLSFASPAVVLFLALSGSALLADGEGRRGARLSPPEGAASPDARGQVVLNRDALLVMVERLPAGDYQVLLDDGKGTLTAIGSITVKAEAAEADDAEGGGEGDEHGEGGEGFLRLSGAALPFGAASPLDLAGRAISVNDKDGKVVLAGKTPSPIVEEPEERSGRCPLARPDPAVDPDAEGVLKLESGGGRVVIKVHLANLDPGKIYEVVFTNPADKASESLGKVTIDDGGNGQFKVDSAKGDSIPFGAGDLAALAGFGVSVKDPTGAVVLTGTICPAQVRPPDDDHQPPHPRCFSAKLDGAQVAPPVTTDATGTAVFQVGGETGTTLRYHLETSGLSGPATAAHIHKGAAGASGDIVYTLDEKTLRGELQITADDRTNLEAGNYYVDVHTEKNPAGEIRGQIAACQDGDGEDEGDDHEDGDGDHEEGDDHDGSGTGGGGGGVAVKVGVVAGPSQEPMFLMVGSFDAPFLRGDVNHDGFIDVSDPVKVLDFLFGGGARPYCLDAADANDDGAVNISDAVSILSYLFIGGDKPADPGVVIAGSDPTPDNLYCEEQ